MEVSRQLEDDSSPCFWKPGFTGRNCVAMVGVGNSRGMEFSMMKDGGWQTRRVQRRGQGGRWPLNDVIVTAVQ